MPDILNRLREPARETRPIDLGDYAEDYRGVVVYVWVTPTRTHVRRWFEIVGALSNAKQRAKRMDEGTEQADLINEATTAWVEDSLAWYAETWVRLEVGDEAQDVTLPVAREIRELLVENLPPAWDWLRQRTHDVMQEYRSERLKN